MRQIGTIVNEKHAHNFGRYLTKQGMGAEVRPEKAGWGIWILSEDQVEAARTELAAFQRAQATGHTDPYDNVPPLENEAEYTKTFEAAPPRPRAPRPRATHPEFSLARSCPVTFGLIAIAVGVSVLTEFSGEADRIQNALSIAPYTVHPTSQGSEIRWFGLRDIQQGEIWRLVTPIFMHARFANMGFLHLLFNMMWMRQLGAAVEMQRGRFHYLWLVLVVAVVSNLGQYFLSGPNFLGMSGVVYGLFGYAWMKSKYDPSSGLYIPPNLVILMVGFFLLCFTGAIGPVANAAHGFGLVSGMLVGIIPKSRRR